MGRIFVSGSSVSNVPCYAEHFTLRLCWIGSGIESSENHRRLPPVHIPHNYIIVKRNGSNVGIRRCLKIDCDSSYISTKILIMYAARKFDTRKR